MNHNHVTLRCARCARPSAVIIGGVYYCSEHALAVTMARVGDGLVVDLRAREPILGFRRRTDQPTQPVSPVAV